jgi:putative hydrolase of HD superfamily
LHYVHQKYVQADERKVIQELAETVPFGDELLTILEEFSERKTKEAMITRDADQLEFILSLKEQIDIGNTRTKTWVPSAVKRLKLKISQDLAEEILKTNSDDWWFSDKDDEWWVNRSKAAGKKRF